MIGKKFDRLTVIKREPRRNKKNSYWLCKCICGNFKVVRRQHLLVGDVRSCGCLAKEISSRVHTKHGLEHTKSYRVWQGMIARCYKKTTDSYYLYGARGIVVCERWKHSIKDFYSDMGECPEEMSIERINTNGNYSPKNCKWATLEEQANNKRNTIRIENNGENLTISQWSRKVGIKHFTIRARLKLGWTFEDAITIPVNRGIKYWVHNNGNNKRL